MSSLKGSYRERMNSVVLVNEDQIEQPLVLNLLQVHIKVEVLAQIRLRSRSKRRPAASLLPGDSRHLVIKRRDRN